MVCNLKNKRQRFLLLYKWVCLSGKIIHFICISLKICKKEIKNPYGKNLTAIYLTEDNNIFRKINTHKVKRTRFS